ncbi:peptide methionine sulfoxide reductase MsrA (S-form specific) [Natrialba magadii ATCC 43099]|uniref:Peptide methionine sulfoxide reductase MsrA n=1 Tax=Natrialba magadii (strain ATCC 43099 / DSM 3394 / CCM 3739 / CIP 104546 / IAM 13178 / JCM 8861 / NBRC 102185 / NCIMB 2190 / MS3) TaxID=547559 RepID=D3SXB6_NATMM|nr:peptide-methionine (S)-S-oxide reductase [Natrialba magadii]ADD03936.1 peptide methionine sulfoxide reductase MsrA (S-form specific) [Natrialba magadii ATCC 43099]ELY33599.1 peptide methionine sulfoxide reductase [Natrialba magadii ATCC 43099]
MTHPDEEFTRQSPDAAGALQPPPETQTATFGMGCFWGPDARFGAMEGVVRTRVGYAGGTEPNPSYYSLGDHTEVVQLEYDPETLSYEDLLEVFWANHSWQPPSRKRQYRGVVLAHDDEQYEAAHRTKDDLAERTGTTVESEIEVLESITLAEDYHQKYELRSTPVAGDELVDQYGDEFVDSTVVARLNGFVAGHGTEEQRRCVLAELDVPATVVAELRRRF